MQSLLDAMQSLLDADLSPDQNSLQLLRFNLVTFVCIFNNKEVPHNTTPFCVHFNKINSQSQPSEIPK